MVDSFRGRIIIKDSSLIFQKRFSLNTGSNWSSFIDFRFNFINIHGEGTISRNGDIRIVV